MKKIISIILILLFITVAFARDRPPKGIYFPATDIHIEGESCEIVDQHIELRFGEEQLHFTYPVEVTVKYTVKSTEDEELKIMLPYVDNFDSEHDPLIYVEDALVDYEMVPIYFAGNFSTYYNAKPGDNNCVFTYMLYKYYKRSNPVADTDISEAMKEYYSMYDKSGLSSFYTDYLKFMLKRSSEKEVYSLNSITNSYYHIGKFAVFEMLLPANTEMDLVVSYQTKCSFYDAFGWEDNTVYYFSYLFQDNFYNAKNPVIDLHTPVNAPYLVSSNIPFDLIEERHYRFKVNFLNNDLEIAVFHGNYMPNMFNIWIRSPMLFGFIVLIIGLVAFFKKKRD